jgi:hypothetical protein
LNGSTYGHNFVGVNAFDGFLPKKSSTFPEWQGYGLIHPQELPRQYPTASIRHLSAPIYMAPRCDWIKLSASCSNWARLSVFTKCFGHAIDRHDVWQVDFSAG